MTDIIAPVDRSLLKQELTGNHMVRPTNKAHNLIYDITAHEAPHVMQEIGRLRELSYRNSGGGSGNATDTDEFDFMEKPYHQLIVWNPEAEEIIGGYRYIDGRDVVMQDNGQPHLATESLFDYSENFIENYLPHTIELGRAFVQPHYQTQEMGAKSLFALDNLWDAIGAIVYQYQTSYLIGKVTMYNTYNPIARDLIYIFLERYFPDNMNLARPKIALELSAESQRIANRIFSGTDQFENYKILQREVRKFNETIPPMMSAYIGISSTMKTFKSCANKEFGDIYETGIMVTISDLFEEKRKRYIEPYLQYLGEKR